MGTNEALPGYTDPALKQALLDVGASGTVYALVMPESEAALGRVVGANRTGAAGSDGHERYLEMFREPWTQKQDAMHEEYLSRWLEWASPVVSVDGSAFPFRYPTAGASEGIVKLMAEYLAKARANGMTPNIHIFEGEYEGFASFANGLGINVVRHARSDWRAIAHERRDGQFWISQPSAIDGMVWDEFDAFCEMMDEHQQGMIEVVPDLSYVGAVARDYRFSLDHRCIRSFAISHSKPFGGYYLRCGGVFARTERPTLFGNIWFKSLTALAWGVDMMRRHDVFALPRKYRRAQEEAAAEIGDRLGIEGLEPCDVMVIARAPLPEDLTDPVIASLVRGKGDGRQLRVCLTPEMTVSIDPALAPEMTRRLTGRGATA
jgi:hypothetical protein